MKTRKSLDAAYRATAYVVDGAEGTFTIRIDRPTPALDDLLVQNGTRCWAFVTACNPGSAPLSDEENRRRQEELERTASDAGYPFFHGQGRDDGGHWPAEPSLLILGIAREDAIILGQRFGQNAIVWGAIGSAAELVHVSRET